MNDQTAARAVVEEYVAACAARDVARLKAIFHPQALMSGYLREVKMLGSPQPFYDAVQQAPAEAVADYYTQIPQLDVTRMTASATLKEQNFLGMNFTNFFHLMKLDGKWQIVSKTFMTE